MATPNHLPSRSWSSSSTNSNKKRQFTVFNDNGSKILESRYVSYSPHDPNRLAGIAAFKYCLESLVPIYWLKSFLVYQNDSPAPRPPVEVNKKEVQKKTSSKQVCLKLTKKTPDATSLTYSASQSNYFCLIWTPVCLLLNTLTSIQSCSNSQSSGSLPDVL